MLKGSKVIIRPLEEGDLDCFYRWYNDQEVNYFANGAWPYTTMLSREEITDRLFENGDSHRYTVLDEEHQPIGTIGFREHNVTARSVVLYIIIGEKSHWDKGYGTDSLQTFLYYLFMQWNLNRVMLDVWDGNQRAINCYEKVGFKVEGRLRKSRFVMGEYRDAIVMGLLKEEFITNKAENDC